MAWERKPFDPNKVYRKPSERQQAQYDWLVAKGQANVAETLILAALHRCGLQGHQLKYHIEQTQATRYYIHQAADKQWQEAQIKYPKKQRSKKSETITSS